MRKSMYVVILGLFILLTAMLPQPAAAFDLFVENPYDKNMWVALRYREDSTGKWVARGWWKVEPYSTRHLEFPSSTGGNYIYLHAYNSEASWGGDRSDPASYMTVIGEAFKYYYQETNCPQGKNRRTVGFDVLSDEGNGVFSWSP